MASKSRKSSARVPAPIPSSAPAPVPEPAGDDGGSRTLRRGLQVLDAVLQGGREGLRVVDLCRAAGLERATVYRLLATLLEAGYLAPRGRFRYGPGPRLALQAQPPTPSDFAARLQPVLARVSLACGDAAFAIVREGPVSHCIARQVGTTRCRCW